MAKKSKEKDIEIVENIAKENGITIQEAIDDNSLIIVKKYIPFEVKKIIIDDIINVCTSIDNGMLRIDYAIKNFLMDEALVNYYTNIQLDNNDRVGNYNLLCENGIITYIEERISWQDMGYIQDILNDEIEQLVKLNNSIEAVINRGINNLILKIPSDKQMSKIVKEISKVDPSKMQYVNTLVDALNSKKSEVKE